MSQKKICGVYKITHIASGKSYIGISKDIHRRWVQHSSFVKTESRRNAIYSAIKKYGECQFTWQIIEECSQDILEERECHWISVFDTFRNGYNLTAGGEYNKVFSEATRKKMSDAHKGKKQSKELIEKRTVKGVNHFTYGKPRPEETRRKISESLKGKKHSEQTKLKMSLSNSGRKLTEDAKKKISLKNKGKKRSDQAIKNISEAHKGIKQSQETKLKRSESLKLFHALKKIEKTNQSHQIH
jgi:group I intron endonuclease